MLAIALPSLLRATPAVSFLHSLTILLRSYILYIKKVLLNQLILSYPVLHSSPSIKHSQNPIPGVLSWLLPTYANIIAMFGQCLPLYLPGFSGQERRWGQALMVAPVMEVKYLSTASSSAMELLALTMEGGQPLQAKMQNQHFQGTIQMSSSHVSALSISHQIPNFGIIDRPFWAFICLWSSVTLTIRSSVCSLPTSIFPLKDIQPSLRATKKVLWLLHSAINCFLTVFGLPISFSRALIQFGSS